MVIISSKRFTLKEWQWRNFNQSPLCRSFSYTQQKSAENIHETKQYENSKAKRCSRERESKCISKLGLYKPGRRPKKTLRNRPVSSSRPWKKRAKGALCSLLSVIALIFLFFVSGLRGSSRVNGGW